MIAALPAQVWWWLARATGIVAWAGTAAAVIWGLALSSKVVRRRKLPAWLLDLHRYLGVLTLVFVGVHLAAIAADSYVSFGVEQLLVPMASGWRPGAITWGIAALYLLLLVQVSSWAMRRIPRRLWRAVHLLSFVVFAAGTVHGALAGADAANPMVQVGALTITVVVLFLVLFRVMASWTAIADEGVERRIARPRAAEAA